MGGTGGQTSSLVFLQYLTAVFDNIADGVVLVAVDGPDIFSLTLANKPFFRFSGYGEDMIGKNLQEFMSPENYRLLARYCSKVLHSKQGERYTHWLEVPAGLRAFDLRLAPVFNTTGECIQIACIIHDATEREQLREEVAHLRETVRGIRSSIT